MNRATPETPPSSAASQSCAICDAADTTSPIFDKWGAAVVECGHCGTAAAVPPDDFDPAAIYTADYYQGRRKDGYADYATSEPVARREFGNAVQHLRRDGIAGGKLLEIGCAYGYFLKEAGPFFECTGVEISDVARERCHDDGLRAFATLDDPEVVKAAPFDALVILDCIEHLENPAGLMRQATALLSERAAILISTGDWDSHLARATRKRWRLMTPPQHLFFFTRKGISELLLPLGFEVVSFKRPWRLIPLGLAAYQLMRRIGIGVRIPRILNRMAVPLNLFDCMRVVARRNRDTATEHRTSVRPPR